MISGIKFAEQRSYGGDGFTHFMQDPEPVLDSKLSEKSDPYPRKAFRIHSTGSEDSGTRVAYNAVFRIRIRDPVPF